MSPIPNSKFLVAILIFLSQVCIAREITPADATPNHYIRMLEHKRVALVINQTSKIGDVSLLDLLTGKQINVVKIFVPEHGFRGGEDAGATIENTTDSATHLPVISLYGSHKKPTAADLADVDVLVYDLQDVGARFYTYISTLEYCMEACAENHRQLIVLDRPNPNGWYVDGPVLEKANKSFVGMQQIPVVYGMTEGEYAHMLAGEGWVTNTDSLDLQVIKCDNYTHNDKYTLPVAPSPNLPNMAAVYAYPSLCLFEGTMVSVGRGTDLPFQQFGCPGLEGKYAYSFTPQSKPGAKHPPYEGKLCYGELAGNTAKQVLAKTNGKMNLQWLIQAYNAYPDKDKFFIAFFPKISGTGKLEEQIKSGADEKMIRASWESDLDAFKKIRKKYLLYPDFKDK